MNRAKNPYTERTLIFSGVLILVGWIFSVASKFVPVVYLSSGLNITGIGIELIGGALLCLVIIMECKYGK